MENAGKPEMTNLDRLISLPPHMDPRVDLIGPYHPEPVASPPVLEGLTDLQKLEAVLGWLISDGGKVLSESETSRRAQWAQRELKK